MDVVKKIFKNGIFALFFLISVQVAYASNDDHKGKYFVYWGNRCMNLYSDADYNKIPVKGTSCRYAVYSPEKVSLKSKEIFKGKNGDQFVNIDINDNPKTSMLCGNNSRCEYGGSLDELKKSDIYVPLKNTDFLIVNGNATTEKLYVKEVSAALNKAMSSNRIPDLEGFIEKYKNEDVKVNTRQGVRYLANDGISAARKRIDVLEKKKIAELFQRSKEAPGIESLENFLEKHRTSTHRNEAVDEIYKRVIALDKFDILVKTTERYQESNYRDEAVLAIYKFIEVKNTIEGYRWFSARYSNSKESHQAMNNMYELAYSVAKKIGTLEAYNDFIIAYPYASQINEAIKTSYSLEREKYSGWFTSDAEDSRALLIQSKRLSRKMQEIDSNSSTKGYLLVIDRMNELLQDEFPTEEATLRHLESEEFKDFVSEFKSAMRSIKRALSDLNDSTANLSSIIDNQSSMMDTHFKNNAQSQKMANQYAKQYQDWERYLKPYGIK